MKNIPYKSITLFTVSIVLFCCVKEKKDINMEGVSSDNPAIEKKEIETGKKSKGNDLPEVLPGMDTITLDELNKIDPGIYEVIIRDFNNDQENDLFIVYMSGDEEYDHYPIYTLYSKTDGKWRLVHFYEDKRYTYIGANIDISEYILLKEKYDKDTIENFMRMHKNKIFFTIHPPGYTGCLLLNVTDEIKVIGEIEKFNFIFIEKEKPDTIFFIVESFETTYTTSLYSGIYKEYYGYELNSNLDIIKLNQLLEAILKDLYTRYKNIFLRSRRISDLRDFFWFLYENMPESINEGWIDYHFQMIAENENYLFIKEAMKTRLVLNDEEFGDYLTERNIDIFIE